MGKKRILSLLFVFVICITSFVVYAEMAENIIPDGTFSVYYLTEATAAEAVCGGGSVMLSEEILSIGGCEYVVYDNSNLIYIKSKKSLAAFRCNSDEYFIDGSKMIFKSSYMSDGRLYIPIELVCLLTDTQYQYDTELNAVGIVQKGTIALQNGTELGDELLEYSDFEDDFISAGAYTNRYAKATLIWEHNIVHSGIGSGGIINRVSPWDSIGQDITSILDISGEGKYKISGWIKMGESDYTMHTRFYVQDSNREYTINHSYNVEAKANEWTYFEYDLDVTLPESIEQAVFYIESSNTDDEKADRQTFYVDDLSVKKYGGSVSDTSVDTELTEEEKAHIADMRKKLSESETIKKYPSESAEILRNPFKGFINYNFKTEEDAASPASKISSVILFRPLWSEIEVEDGVYDWSLVDQKIELAKNNGMQVALGFQPAYNNALTVTSGNVVRQATPLWVFDKGCKYTTTYGWGQTALVPIWDDPIYLEEQQKFINAVMERYGNNPYIASIDLRSYGNWGEFHVAGLTGRDETDDSKEIDIDAMKTIIDLWKDCKLPLLMFVANKPAYEYAIDTYNTGIRMDGGMRVSSSDYKRLLACEGKGPAVCEWLEPGYKGFMPGGIWEANAQDVPVMFEQLFTIAKVTMMSMGNNQSNEFYQDYTRICDYWANRMGYWFKVSEIEYPKSLNSGVFRIKVRNDGVAPIYAGNHNSACVQLALLDQKGNVLKKTKLDIDLSDWKPGEYVENYCEYDFGDDVNSDARLALGVFSNETLETPNIKLAMECETANGWYLLDMLPQNEDEIISANCLYTSSKLCATPGYGYHHPDHAFDNSLDTYWSLEWAKEGWLECDFGRERKISQVILSSSQLCNVKFNIEAYADGEWVTLSNRSALKSGETTVNFKKRTASKLRIHVTDMAIGDIFMINEMKVK